MALTKSKVDELGLVSVISNPDVALLFEKDEPVRDQSFSPTQVKSGKTVTIKKETYKYMPWGSNNLKPQEMLQLVSKNHTKPQLIETQRDFLMGSTVFLFKKNYETTPNGVKKVLEPIKISTELEDLFEQIELQDYLLKAASDLCYSKGIPTLVNLNSDSTLKSLDVVGFELCRKTYQEKGIVKNVIVHPDWKNYSASDAIVKQMFDPSRMEKGKTSQLEFIDWVMDYVSGQYYYSYPAWWGTEEWTKISNKIPVYHNSGLDNGYNFKYVITIPYAYVAKIAKSEDPKDILAARQTIKDEMDRFLAGKADVALITMSVQDAMGKEVPGWKVEPIENLMTDDAYIKLDAQSNINQANGHGIFPALAGIDTGGKLGGSGSELRITYQLYLALRTPQQRERLLHTLNTVVRKILIFQKLMDRDTYFGIEDIDLTTLDKNPTGTQAVVNQAQ